MPTRVLMVAARVSLGCSTSLPGTLVYAGAAEKYFGIITANRGRMAGRQAQTIPTFTSTADRVTWSELSND